MLERYCRVFSLLSRYISGNVMLDGGHVRADVCDAQKSASILKAYFEHMKARIAERGNSTLFVIGDGNHSLMAAKQAWIDAGTDMHHPDRWALVELVNIHDVGLSIFPIHRILRNVSSEKFFKVLHMHGILKNKRGFPQNDEVLVINKSEYTWMPHDTNNLSIEIFESILEKHKELYHTVDFIHDEAEVRSHASCASSDTIGFIFPHFRKDAIFRSVHEKKIFPRKSFALGNSTEKRYYIEACDRSISY